MKRIFIVIIVLITLSVLGILVMQGQWIRNAMLVKKEQERVGTERALRSAGEQIREVFLAKQGVADFITEDMRETVLRESFTVQIFTQEEIHGYLARALQKERIKRPFEFAVMDIYNIPIIQSPGWHVDLLKQEGWKIPLTPEGARLPETLVYYSPPPPGGIEQSTIWMIVASFILIGIVISAFTVTLRTLVSQKKLSEIKSDFINNMTHEFKTPLATISLAVDALQNDKVVSKPDQIRYYGGMIKEENKRMNKQVETILQAARLERDEIKLALAPIDAHALIRKVAETLKLQIEQKDGSLELLLNATNPVVKADEVHFSNIIYNLLDNAFKYSPEKPTIRIETSNASPAALTIRVRDNGIGMTKETAARVFEKFYRAHTGNLHNVKGFGLGLSYVKAIVDAHGGKVKVESAVGKGSTFTVVWPVA